MKVRTVAWVTCAAMVASCAFVYTITPPGGAHPNILERENLQSELNVSSTSPAHFTGGTTLKVDARLGYQRLPRAGARENLLLVQVAATEDVGEVPPLPTSTALVIDRSGSMNGLRLTQALTAAQQWVAQLHDGDRISVVTFDGNAQMVVPTTTLDRGSRKDVAAALTRITAGGNTCLSCGIDMAQQMLGSHEGLRRMIVLSDGHANSGARTVAELRQLASSSRSRDTSIVTLGVGESYSEAALAALAFDTNGSHHFVENPFAMSSIFATEASKLAATVATEGEVVLTFDEDVELVRVFDRAHRREGNRVIVPLGAFSAGQQKTVLAEIRVRGDGAKLRRVADVDLRFRNNAATAMKVRGNLGVMMGDQRSALDPMVSVRLAKADGAEAIQRAASLFEQGRRQDAIDLLDTHNQALSAEAMAAPRAAASAFASAMATASAVRERIQAAPSSAGRSEVLRSKATATRQLE